MILINRKDLPESNAVCKVCGHKYRLCNKCLQLRSMGLEYWREYCDCVECFQVYTVLSKNIEDITKEEFDYISAIELPVGQEYTAETKAKFKEVKKHFDALEKKERQDKGQLKDYKKYDYGYDKKKSSKTQYKQ